jgi:uncharacterized membrane protein SirB2
MIYTIVHHLHSTLATLILLLLLFRLFLKLRKSNLLNKPWVKIPAHLFDTVIILLGLTLLHFNNWVFHGWLVLKLIAIIIYILSTFYAMKKATNSIQVLLFGILSTASILFIFALAHSKSIFFL